MEALLQLNFAKPVSQLQQHAPELKAYFEANPPLTLKQAAAAIETITGIRRSTTQVAVFLGNLGFKRLKAYSVPAKFDSAAQADFKKRVRATYCRAEAQAGQRHLFFVDSAHFVLGSYLGFVWCLSRLILRAPSGRQRFNVLGALNALTHQVITATNESYINANSVCELLDKIVALKLKEPITLVLDNARYQHCRLVMERAASIGIELLFLPPYSPNLNLIERLWGFVRSECLNNQYYVDFASFKLAITNCIAQTTGNHRAAMVQLLTLKFQVLENATFALP